MTEITEIEGMSDGEFRHVHLDADEHLMLNPHKAGTIHLTFIADPEPEPKPDPDILPGVEEGIFPSATPEWTAADPDAYYTFNLFGVWTRDDVAYWETDSGCSCPSPWEGLKRYSQLNSGTLGDCVGAFIEWANNYNHSDDGMRAEHQQEIGELVNHLMKARVG